MKNQKIFSTFLQSLNPSVAILGHRNDRDDRFPILLRYTSTSKLPTHCPPPPPPPPSLRNYILQHELKMNYYGPVVTLSNSVTV